MARELSQNERRLSVLGAICLFWGALLVAIGFTVPFVAIVVGGLLVIGVIGLQGRALAGVVEPALRRASGRVLGAFRAASTRIAGVEWSAKAESARRRGAAAQRRAAGGMKSALAAGGAAMTGVESRGRELAARRTARPAAPDRREAMRLSQQAAVLRAEERLTEAAEAGEHALAIFRMRPPGLSASSPGLSPDGRESATTFHG